MKVLGLGPKPCEVDDLACAHAAVGKVQELVRRNKGTICRLICDDKGTRFLIAFGVPGQAGGDDARRAVAACLGIERALLALNSANVSKRKLTVATGVTTGRVFCGEAGYKQRREYTLSGSEVNLAARLMQVTRRGAVWLCHGSHVVTAAYTSLHSSQLSPSLCRLATPLPQAAAKRDDHDTIVDHATFDATPSHTT